MLPRLSESIRLSAEVTWVPPVDERVAFQRCWYYITIAFGGLGHATDDFQA
jgi:hypothetical protein